MLERLRAHSLVRGHDQDHCVQPMHAGQHVADEACMAGHVDDSHLEAARQLQVGETQIDGHPTPLLFGEPIGIDARQCPAVPMTKLTA